MRSLLIFLRLEVAVITIAFNVCKRFRTGPEPWFHIFASFFGMVLQPVYENSFYGNVQRKQDGKKKKEIDPQGSNTDKVRTPGAGSCLGKTAFTSSGTLEVQLKRSLSRSAIILQVDGIRPMETIHRRLH